MRLIYLPLFALLACSDNTILPPAGDGGQLDGTKLKDVNGDTSQDMGDTYVPPPCTVTGTVTDMKDVAWGLAKLQVCSTVLCKLGTADGSGVFHVGVPCNAHYHVLAQPPMGDTHNTSDGIGVIAGDVTTDVTLMSNVRIPETGAPIALTGGSQAVNVATGLTLTTDPMDLNFSAVAQLAGVLVDKTKWPAFAPAAPDGGTATILAMWALLPWGTTTKPGDAGNRTIAVTIANSFGFAANATVSLYQVSETTAQLLLPPGTGTVSSDGKTINGGTVTRVTWIVLTSP